MRSLENARLQRHRSVEVPGQEESGQNNELIDDGELVRIFSAKYPYKTASIAIIPAGRQNRSKGTAQTWVRI